MDGSGTRKQADVGQTGTGPKRRLDHSHGWTAEDVLIVLARAHRAGMITHSDARFIINTLGLMEECRAVWARLEQENQGV